MSTRSTIAHGEGWHVFHEIIEGTVHVSLVPSDLEMEIVEGRIALTLRLPAEVLAALQNVKECEPWKMASDEELVRRGFLLPGDDSSEGEQ